jgi:hypothetical protein
MTFCSVIEFGIVSYLHRRIERKKKKKIQPPINNPKPKIKENFETVLLVPQNRFVPEQDDNCDLKSFPLIFENNQNKLNFYSSDFSLNSSDRFQVLGKSISHIIPAEDKPKKKSMM